MDTSVVELLSDSDDTIIMAPNELLEVDSDPDVANIVNKYISENLNAGSERYEYHEFSDEEMTIPQNEKLQQTLLESSSQDEPMDDDNVLQLLSEKYKPLLKDDSDDKCNIDNKPKNTKEAKMEERAHKKIEKEREKNLKKAMTTANKNIKPGQCMKFVCVNLDKELMDQECSNEIITTLEAAGIKYETESQVIPNTISWTRKVESHVLDDNGQLVLSTENQQTDEILLIMNCKDFVTHVDKNNLSIHIQSLKSILENKKIILVVYGLQDYLRHQTNQKYQKSKFQDHPKISKQTIEFSLTELQILCNCSHRLLNTPEQVALTVAQFTKSIAQLPFKQQKYEKYQQIEWYAAGDNRDCVKVDQQGNGLQRLYKQMLTTFPLASLETAEAISSIYPTMKSLMQAYENCDPTQAESLLKDIPIRRAAGPLSTTRKIGPELSRKVYNFFCSRTGDDFL